MTNFVDASGAQFTSVIGTKENALCSNRGLCDRSTGVCSCFDTFGDIYASSNGYGAAGTRGDCGWVESSLTNTVSSCPGEIQVTFMAVFFFLFFFVLLVLFLFLAIPFNWILLYFLVLWSRTLQWHSDCLGRRWHLCMYLLQWMGRWGLLRTHMPKGIIMNFPLFSLH